MQQTSESQHFDNLATEWWNPQGAFKTLHQVNPLRLAFMQRFDLLAGLQVLDVGCGGGLLAEALATAGAKVTAIDISWQSIEAAKQHAKQANLEIDYQCVAIDELKQKATRYDLITCMEMLEHVDKPADILNAISHLLKEQGVVYCSTLNRNVQSWFLGIIMAEKVLRWIPEGTHNHGKFIKPSELTTMARDANLKFTHSNGIIWNPLTFSFELSEQRLDINYLMRFQKS